MISQEKQPKLVLQEAPIHSCIGMKPLTLIALNGCKAFHLEKDFTLIGRQEICDLRIDHKSVSKQHCVLFKRGNRLWLRDLGSTNGSHVNGKRVRRSQVNVKDVLGIAGFSFRLSFADEPMQERPDGGTKKLNAEEIRRLEQNRAAIEDQDKPVAAAESPMVQVNALPDEYTPVADQED